MPKNFRRRHVVLVAAAALALAVLGQAAGAEDYAAGSLQIGNPWTRATPRGANVAGAYLTITNKGSAADRLVGGSTEVAARFEMHNQVVEKGVAKMRPMGNGIEIKPGATVEFKPGGLHVMLVGLKEPLRQGQRVKGTLVFEKAGTVEVEYLVAPIGAQSGGTSQKHQQH